MNLIEISTKFISFLFFIILVSCSSNKELQKITIESFLNDIAINEGDSALIKWDVKNADSVYLMGMEQVFYPIDSVFLSPLNDTTYSIVAVNPIDTQRIDVHIFVNHPAKEVQTGAEIIKKKFDEPSLEISDYLKGMLPSSVRFNLKNLKIIRTDLTDNALILNILPIDEFGNFITNLNLDSLNLSLEAISYGMKMSFNQKLIKENKFADTSHQVSIHFLIETSLASYELSKVGEQVRKAIGNFDNTSRVSLASFNQNLEMHIDNKPSQQAFAGFLASDLKPSGTAAYSSAIISTLQRIKESNDPRDNIIVLLAYSEENSSITSTLDEALKIAASMHIPIYVLTLSRDCKSYQMNAIAGASGGRLYSIETNDFDKISNIISEIYYGQKVNYQYRLSFLNEIKNYPDLRIDASVYCNQKFIDDSKKFYVQIPDIYVPYQLLSIFDYASNALPQIYFPKLSELANLLKNNPNSIIEITAYSYFEIDSAEDYTLALERAKNVMQILIDSGANPEQIRIKSRGNENPLYYLPTKEWQMSYNRRAEIRWLDPELLPFEIVAQTAISESDALSKVENWEKLGFRSYYQRYIINNDVQYKVKIWGYSTEKDAQNEIKKLQERFPQIHFKLE